MMPIDMTTQLAPLFWGMVAFLAISVVGITFAVLHGNEGEGMDSTADRGIEKGDHDRDLAHAA